MSHGGSRPIIVVTASRGEAPGVVLRTAGTHQNRHSPRPRAGSPATHGGSKNASQVTSGVLAALPNVTVTRGTGTVPTRFVQALGASYHAPQTNPPQPASGRSSPALSQLPSAYLPSPRPRLPPPRPQTRLSNPPYRAASDNQDRANFRGFHYVEGTNGARLRAGHARVFAVGTTPPAVDADRRNRYLVGPEYFVGGVPIARRYLDVAWGVTPGTKESLGLTD